MIWVYSECVVLTWLIARLQLLSDFWQIRVKPGKTKKQPWTFGCRQILGFGGLPCAQNPVVWMELKIWSQGAT